MSLDIIIVVVPVFLVILLGYGVKRFGLVDRAFLFQLNKLVFYLALPLLLFYKISTADFSKSFNGALVLGLAISLTIGFSLAYGYAALRNYPPAMRGAFAQGAFRGNFAFVGLAIVFNAFGEEGLARAGIVLGGIVPLMSLLAVIGLLMPHETKDAGKHRGHLVREIICNPLIFASIIGIVWSLLSLPMPEVMDSALHIVTGMTLPLALISIGASFSPGKLRGDMGKALMATVMKLVMMPLLTAVILWFIGVRGEDLAIGVLLAATPTAMAAYIMAEQMKGDSELSGAIIMLSTLLSPVTFTISLYLLKVSGVTVG